MRPANQLHFLLYADAIYRMPPELNSVDKAKNWVKIGPLKNLKPNFRFIIYSRSSTKPAHLVKIGPADFEIIGLK